MKVWILLLFGIVALGVNAADPVPASGTTASAKQPEKKTPWLELLANGKIAQAKLQTKQNCSAELKAIAEAKKTIEAARLKAAIEFTKQQAELTDKTALEGLEKQRKAVSEHFNELLRLIDQVDKNRQTALLPEKLDALVVFLEPAASAEAKAEAAKAPPKSLLRGAALVKEKAATQAKK